MNIKIGVDKNTNDNIELCPKSRSKAVSIIGPKSSGKFSLSILNMINEDIKSKKGVIYIGDNKNLSEAILNIAIESDREYSYIDLSGEGADSFNILGLLNKDAKISNCVEKNLLEGYELYLKERVNKNEDIKDILDKSYTVISMFLGVLKEFKGDKMNIRDLYLLSKDDPDLINLVFMGHEKGKSEKQRLMVKMFKRWHELTYCNDKELYGSMAYFREMMEEILDDKDLEKSIIYGKLPELDLLNSIEKNEVIIFNLSDELSSYALFINRLMCSIVASLAKLNGTTECNLYINNCANYITKESIEVLSKVSDDTIGLHISEESFNPECIDKSYLSLIKNSVNIILYPGCTKEDELIFKEMISDFTKKEIKSIGEIRFSEFKTATAKLLEQESVTLRKLMLSFID